MPPSLPDAPELVRLPPSGARLGFPLPGEPPPLPPALPRLRPVETFRDKQRVAGLIALFATVCAVFSYTEWDTGVSRLVRPSGGGEPVAAAEAATPEPPQDPSGLWPDPLVSLYESRADAARPIKLKFSIIDPSRAASRARPAKPKAVGTVARAAPSQPLPRWPSRPATMPPTVAPVPPPRPVPAAEAPRARPTPAMEARLPPAEVRPTPVPAVAVAVEPLPGDEERIRATLSRFGTAYSRLDAGAARAVWPSVDVRALERAFDGLKSQELRFDRCSLAVDGVRARAACTGRAVYVPRIGNQSPRTTSREWTFELKKAEQGWTIASARSS